LGKTKEAMEFYQTIIDESPGSDEAKVAHDRIKLLNGK
jgi:hypothetical protein